MRTKKEILDHLAKTTRGDNKEKYGDLDEEVWTELFCEIRDQLERIADYLDPQKDWSPKEFDVNKEIIERTLKEPDNK